LVITIHTINTITHGFLAKGKKMHGHYTLSCSFKYNTVKTVKNSAIYVFDFNQCLMSKTDMSIKTWNLF